MKPPVSLSRIAIDKNDPKARNAGLCQYVYGPVRAYLCIEYCKRDIRPVLCDPREPKTKYFGLHVARIDRFRNLGPYTIAIESLDAAQPYLVQLRNKRRFPSPGCSGQNKDHRFIIHRSDHTGSTNHLRLSFIDLNIMNRLTVLAALTLALVISAGAHQKFDDEADIRKVIQALGDTMGHNDAAGLLAMTTTDYSFINQNGALLTREQRFAPIKSGQLKYESVKYEDVRVRVYGTAAVVTSRVVVVGKNGATDISAQFRSTLTLIKQKGGWMIVAAQATQMPSS